MTGYSTLLTSYFLVTIVGYWWGLSLSLPSFCDMKGNCRAYIALALDLSSDQCIMMCRDCMI